jgi:hypothetical protein
MVMASSGPPSTTAQLTYSIEPANGVRAFQTINADPNTGQRKMNVSRIQKEVVIENLRGREDSASLDTTGFQLYNRPSKHRAFMDDAEIEREYYPESIELIKELTGASKVVLFDHSKPTITYIHWSRVGEYPDSTPSPPPWRDRRFA